MRGSFDLFHCAGTLALALLLLGPARAEDELNEAEGAVGPDLTDDEWIYKPTDSMIFNTIAKGRRGTVMAPFSDQLTPEEIWKIVEFLRDKNRQRHLKLQ